MAAAAAEAVPYDAETCSSGGSQSLAVIVVRKNSATLALPIGRPRDSAASRRGPASTCDDKVIVLSMGQETRTMTTGGAVALDTPVVTDSYRLYLSDVYGQLA